MVLNFYVNVMQYYHFSYSDGHDYDYDENTKYRILSSFPMYDLICNTVACSSFPILCFLSFSFTRHTDQALPPTHQNDEFNDFNDNEHNGL